MAWNDGLRTTYLLREVKETEWLDLRRRAHDERQQWTRERSRLGKKGRVLRNVKGTKRNAHKKVVHNKKKE